MTFLTKGSSGELSKHRDLSFTIKKAGKDYLFTHFSGKQMFTEADSLLKQMRTLVRIVSPVDLTLLLVNKFSKKYVLDNTPPSDINEILSEMHFSELDLSLKKDLFRFPLAYGKFGEKYNHILSNARFLLPSNSLKLAFDKIVSYINPQWTEACYMSWVKDFGTFLLEKVINENYPLFLLYFVEIHMLSGYDTYLHRKFDIKKDVEPFTKPRHLDSKYLKIFKKHIDKTIENIQVRQLPNCNFDDFVKYRDNWNLMGSATLGIPMKVKTEGFRKASRIASKTTNLLYYDDKTLMEQLRKYEGHVIRPFLKTDEAAKSRVVIGYDTRSYIRCSFLEKFIVTFNGDRKWTTVGDDPEKMYFVRDIINKNIINKEYRMICTDQSAFDQHQYKELFVYAFNRLASKIYSLNPQVEEIIKLEQYGMKYAHIDYPDGSRSKWENGLLSGHKFTALIGSILNRSATYSALELANIQPKFAVFQGDDALLMINKKDDYHSFLEQYTNLGLVVNPMKTWHGLDRTEYLHQVYTADKVIALPMRACLGLYFKDPKSLDVAPDAYFNANLDQFRMARRRGLNVDQLALNYTRKFFNRYGIFDNSEQKKLDSYNFLHTPTLYSGGGFEPYVQPKYYRKLIIIKEQAQNIKSEIITPYHYRIAGDPILTQDWVLKKIYAHLPAPGIKTSIRINRVDFTKTNHIPRVSKNKEYFSYDETKFDNTSNWINHCKSLLNQACEFGMDNINRFNRIRSKISDSFNLISNISNSFIANQSKNFWKYIYRESVSVYTYTRISLRRIEAYMEYWRNQIFKNYRENPPDWYNYGYYF